MRESKDTPGGDGWMSKKKDLSFEDRMSRLQEIVRALENGEKSLHDSVSLYKEGLEHTTACREQLAKAKHEITVFSEGGLSPFDPDTDEDPGEDDRRD